MPGPARAQERVVTVLVDASFRVAAARFIEGLPARLPPAARASVRFETRIVTPESFASLRGGPWEMAILSTQTLTDLRARTNASAFDMPFVFPSTGSVIGLQKGPLGKAGLSTLSEQGLTGLVYLNSSLALVAGRGQVKGLDDLKGRKVVAFLPSHQQILAGLGTSTVMARPGDVASILQRGAADSVVISTANPAGWVLPGLEYLVADGLKAQVGMVVAQKQHWDRLPFPQRAMFSDAVVAMARSVDDDLVESEKALFGRAREFGVPLVNLKAEDTARATEQWISMQPEAVRGTYSSIFTRVKNAPLTPPVPGRGGQAGKIHFATTRDVTGDSSLLYRFGDSRTEVVKCGEIEFPTANPTQEAGHFVGTVTADSAACGARINEVLQRSKRMLIFVHGYNNRFSEAAERGMLLKNALGDDTEVVVWSWPSRRDAEGSDYDYDKESASGVSRQYFVRFLRALRTGAENVPLSILAHSMGGWHTKAAMDSLVDHADRPKLRNIVFAAPDVPTDEFRLSLGDLSKVSQRRSLYACAWDAALILSQSINAYPRAGIGGERDIIVSDKLDSIDVAPTWSTNHSYVFQAGKVLTDLTSTVVADKTVDQRGLTRKPKAPWHYWAF